MGITTSVEATSSLQPSTTTSPHTSSLLLSSSPNPQAAAITTETTWIQASDGTPLTLTSTPDPSRTWTETVLALSTTETNTLITFTIPPIIYSDVTYAAETVTEYARGS